MRGGILNITWKNLNKMLFSILIPTTNDREVYFADVMSELCRRVKQRSDRTGEDYWRHVEILKDPRCKEFSIGEKRNDLLFAATGEYVAFVDSDDMVSPDYIDTAISNIRQYKPDCLSLRGIMTTDGVSPEVFEHSLKYSAWKDNGAKYPAVRYERYPNHLNVIRADIAKQFKFPETNHGEDQAWSKAIHEAGLLKNEVHIDKVLYYYQYRTKKIKHERLR